MKNKSNGVVYALIAIVVLVGLVVVLNPSLRENIAGEAIRNRPRFSTGGVPEPTIDTSVATTEQIPEGILGSDCGRYSNNRGRCGSGLICVINSYRGNNPYYTCIYPRSKTSGALCGSGNECLSLRCEGTFPGTSCL